MAARPDSEDDDDVATSYQEALRRGVPLRDPDGTLSYPSSRSRPKPDFTLDPLHRGLMGFSVVVPVVLLVLVAIRLPSMPDQVPVHFSFDGSVNRYGSPWEGLIAGLVLCAIIIGIAVLARYPRIFNYPTELNSSNVQVQYKNAVQMLVWMNLGIAILAVGSFAVWFDAIPIHLVWVGLAVIGLSAAVFIGRMFKLR